MNDITFFNLLKDFIFEIYPIAKSTIDSKQYYIPKHDKYPNVTIEKNKMPYINLDGDKPKNINSVLTISDVDLNEYDSYKKCVEYIKANEYFSKIIFSYESSQIVQHVHINAVLVSILKRYYLLNTDKENNEELLINIYQPLEYPAFNDRLYIDITIPILYVNFDCDSFDINNNCQLRKISEDHQKSRILINSETIPNRLISAATHELRLIRWYVDSEIGTDFLWHIHKEKVFPTEIFDNFITAIKICADINSGFAQILIYPYDWAVHYNLDLLQVHGITVKKYPHTFENNYTIDTVPQISQSDLQRICSVFNLIQNNTHNKIKIACERLKYSFMRDNDEDSILDSIIGLEVLFSDGERGEITHKLAMRLSKLISMFDKEPNPLETLKAIKDIYGYRSKIVHGSQPKSSSSPKDLSQKQQATVLKQQKYKDLANCYLRTAIELLLSHQEFLDVKKIDERMLMSN